ncbi:MAG: sigma 54-interacting transcriptional regulator [Acidobacteriota bacterium]
MTTTDHPIELSFCLHGEIEGDERRFPLSPGVHVVGSSRSADIVLALPGVSRQHARIDVADNEIRLSDLRSKNGTYVDDQKIEVASLHLGDRVRFGPMALTVTSMDPEDGALGLELDLPAESVTRGERTIDSTLMVEAAPSNAATVELLITVVDLLTLPRPDLHEVAERLRAALDAEAVALVEGRSPTRQPTVVAAAGTVGELPTLDALVGGSSADGLTAALQPTADAFIGWLAWSRDGCRPSRILLDACGRLVRRLAGEAADDDLGVGDRAAEPAELDLPEGIVRGRSPDMLALYQHMTSIARTDVPVLVLGETGVGKEHIARTLHRSSDRRAQPFVAVNCAAIPAELLEAEMFGIAKGVATGVDARPGCFRQANGGTLFLDEVGDLPLALQAKLLRVLQDGQVQPVGAEPVTVDVRIVAATNVDLDDHREAGRFRSDLYFRLAGFELEVPPLRRRPDDLAPLIAHFLERFGHEAGKPIRGLSIKALRLLTAYRWPGNVRELEHEIRRLAFRSIPRQAIDSTLLSPRILHAVTADPEAGLDTLDRPDGRGLSLDQRLDTLQTRLIRRALAATAGNQTRAADVLGISRSGLIKRMKRLGIDPKAV